MKNEIKKTWDMFLDVPYISVSPGVTYGSEMSGARRVDINPGLNDQPWFHGSNKFKTAERTVAKNISKRGEK